MHVHRDVADPGDDVPQLVGTRVFVAEDEPILLWALEDVLSGLGCTVVGATGRVTQGLEFVANNTFDVAVLDGSLIDGSVEPLAEVLRARDIPFILASGSPASDFSEAFHTAIFIRKPYRQEDLKDALGHALIASRKARAS